MKIPGNFHSFGIPSPNSGKDHFAFNSTSGFCEAIAYTNQGSPCDENSICVENGVCKENCCSPWMTDENCGACNSDGWCDSQGDYYW